MAKNTTIIEITQAIEDRLFTILPARLPSIFDTLDRSQILWAIDECAHIKGDFDIVLKLNRESNMIPIDDGGGRAALRCSQSIDVFCRTQTAISQFGNDKEKIRKHFLREQGVLDALANIMLADADGYDLLTRPLLWLGTTMVTKDKTPTKSLWSQTAMTFECHFKPLLFPLVLD